MRKKLASVEGDRKRFRGVFTRLGKKTNYQGYREDTILLKHIVDAATGDLLTDHAWFSYTKGFEKLSLTEGVVVEFEARVREYLKGYSNPRHGIDRRRKDFRFSHPTKLRIVPGGTQGY